VSGGGQVAQHQGAWRAGQRIEQLKTDLDRLNARAMVVR
jgi:hypothetical protein